jgi:hypothetical protein
MAALAHQVQVGLVLAVVVRVQQEIIHHQILVEMVVLESFLLSLEYPHIMVVVGVDARQQAQEHDHLVEMVVVEMVVMELHQDHML